MFHFADLEMLIRSSNSTSYHSAPSSTKLGSPVARTPRYVGARASCKDVRWAWERRALNMSFDATFTTQGVGSTRSRWSRSNVTGSW